MVHEIITARIVELLEQGTIPWRKPWRSDAPSNLISRRPYRGVNAFLLNALGFESPFFLTFNQAKQLGGRIRKGEKGCPVVFWQCIEKEKEGGEKEQIPLLRYYTVFNVGQCDGIEAPEIHRVWRNQPLQACERIVQGMPQRPTIIHGGNEAVYYPLADRVKMPPRGQFEEETGYYATLFHELTHATGHETRLARKGIMEAGVRFGSETYSAEELIAEMGASFLCGHAGIENATLENSAAYIAGWLRKLNSEKRLVVTAAGQAQKACDFVVGRIGAEKATE